MSDTPDLYHERIKTPLFHVSIDVMASDDMMAMGDHVSSMYPGVDLNLSNNYGGYSAFVSGPVSAIIVLINTSEIYGRVTPMTSIVHECTHLSWNVLKAVGVKITEDNHEIQAYLMENLVMEVSRIVEKLRSAKEDQDLGDV